MAASQNHQFSVPTSSAPSTAITCEHTVQFYSTDEHLVDELSRFIGSALVRGDAAVVICTEAHGDAIEQRMRCRASISSQVQQMGVI